MATTRGQLDDDGARGVDTPDRRSTGGNTIEGTGARLGVYVVAAVLLVTGITAVDAGFADYAMADALPVLENPEQGGAGNWEPPGFASEGSWDHPLGTDGAGRDHLSRLVYGGGTTVTVGVAATVLGMVGGVTLGSVAGYAGGLVDAALAWVTDTVYAVPAVVVVVLVSVFASGNDPTVAHVAVGTGVALVPPFARVARNRMASVRDGQYVAAARAAGVKRRTVLARHVIPNAVRPLLGYVILYTGVAILLIAGASFLGFGVQSPTPEWGEMLRLSFGAVESNPWANFWPGVAIVVTATGFTLLGDGLSAPLDGGDHR